MIIGLTMIVLPVSDWAAAREWYVSKLGCKLVEEYPEDGYGEYTLGDGAAAIGLWRVPNGYTVLHSDNPKSVAPQPYIKVDDLAASVAELEAKGVVFDVKTDEGDYKTARFHDPEGHILFLYELAGS
jgi:catechol 2,3-dioxygenase-like lactoylglutathione lyase family enzyme